MLGDFYTLKISSEVLTSKENVLASGKALATHLDILKKASGALKIHMPEGYILEATNVGVTKFVVGDDEVIWLWEVVFEAKFNVPGEGYTGPGPGKISVFVLASGKVIVPTKDNIKEAESPPKKKIHEQNK